MEAGSVTPQELVAHAAAALEARREEINRLNVFPVPDGDTGTNMSLTMDSVVSEIATLAPGASISRVCEAISKGSLMGARGNSGVILSQILRGFCEVMGSAQSIDVDVLADASERAVEVAFQAVRKPVEGTMLTVLRDTAQAARAMADDDAELHVALESLTQAAVESVRRTPDLLPVLKEAGVVDAGGLGLAVLVEGLVATFEGHDVRAFDVTVEGGQALAVEPVNDWDDDEYLYCTEFLLIGDGLDKPAIDEWISAAGGSELVVGEGDILKVHVHTDDPAAVLTKATAVGEVAEVHIHNMRQQTAERRDGLDEPAAPVSDLGVVAVASGSGIAKILESLGVDAIVEGGQTMNPSTADIAAAADGVAARTVIVLPNNKNIIMAAQQADELSARDVRVLPTKSVLEAFSAMLVYDPEGDLDSVIQEMEQAAKAPRVGEVTTAVKDSSGTPAGDVSAGQVIGIHSGEIVTIGDDVLEVSVELMSRLADGAETLTLLAGEDLSDESMEALCSRFSEEAPQIEIDALRGEQPLYPVIFSVE